MKRAIIFHIFALVVICVSYAQEQFTEQTSISLTGVWSNGYGAKASAWGDYDNDGDLDIIITGSQSSGSYVSIIYRNDGNNTFTEQISISLTGVVESAVDWGDYDNDGDLDLLLAGAVGPGSGVSKIYRNGGDGTFTEQGIALTGVGDNTPCWADYDNDGNLDILIVGGDGSGHVAKIYRNNADNTFTEQTSILLTGLASGAVCWGDYDNDGDLDLLHTGWDGSMNVSKIYKNNADNTFSEQTSILLTAVQYSSAAWGDYDNDGFLDILLTGYTGSNNVSEIYRNNGDNTFTEQTSISLHAVSQGSSAWGDYNNDGFLDIILTGSDGTNPITKIYRNNADNTFTEISTSLTPVHSSSAAWGDYDNDGDLDILLTGWDGAGPVSKIFRNNNVTPNTLPSAPANLAAAINAGDVTFSWNKSTDNETPQNGLKYNLVIGTSPNAVNKMSPMSDRTTGFRRVINLGNTNHTNSWTIKGLPTGRYFWSVQAVDNSFAGSRFANEQCFNNPFDKLYLTSSPTVFDSLVYPNDAWPLPAGVPFTDYPGDGGVDWGFLASTDYYIVPEPGSFFGASTITVEWDNTQYGYAGVTPGNIYGSGYFNTLLTTTGTITRLTIDGGLYNVNQTTAGGGYIAKISLNLLKTGYAPVNFYSYNFRYYDGLGGQGGVYFTDKNAKVKNYLGDVVSTTPASQATGDGKVNVDDLNFWSASYWSGVPGFTPLYTNYKAKYDIGPTSTNTVYGMPVTDKKIQFEDLVIFAMSYGLSGNGLYPKAAPVPTEPVEISVGKPLAVGSETLVPLFISGAVQDLRAASLSFSGSFGKLISAEKGDLLNSYTTPVMLMSRADGNNVFVDLSIIGADVKGLGEQGQLIVLRFEGKANVNITSAELRNTANVPMLSKLINNSKGIPTEFGISQNYPNPFNPSTMISYQVPVAAMVQIAVFNSIGEKVGTLVNEVKEPGYYEVTWNAETMPSGVYFFRINAGEFTAVKKMMLTK